MLDNVTPGINRTIDKDGSVFLWETFEEEITNNSTLGFMMSELYCVLMYVEYNFRFVVTYFCVEVVRHVIQELF